MYPTNRSGTGPSRATAGPGNLETIIAAGTLSQPHSVCTEINTRPLTIRLEVWGALKAPPACMVGGGAPAEKMDFMHISG